MFPNPTTDILNVQLKSDEIFIESIDVFNVHGKQIINFSNPVYGNQVKLDMSQLSQGIYFLRLRSGQYAAVQRFIKQ